MPDYHSSALQIEDAQRRHRRFAAARPVQSKTRHRLDRVEGISIRNSAATEGATTFISMDHVTGQGLFAENDLSGAQRSFNVAPRLPCRATCSHTERSANQRRTIDMLRE
jgi:hypothetical protein